MRLKSLRMHGFKSFAQRTEFTFPEGLTCIVGPNGCGKSNVVDAIKWVMGEQRASALRGSDMADVIFGGTAGRKALGMAEVTLQFDNSENLLGVDWSEVEITRRIYRDGSSEYLLNKNRCRLKDLRELFMDTGGGRGGMTIMEQGKIDQILREGHQERRAVFEEAAGVSKYKARRKESLKRLERVEADLLRVSDVVAEKQRLVRSLKIAAGRAERYQALVDEMRQKRLQLAVHRYGALLREREEATGRVEELAVAEAAAREEVTNSVAECRTAEHDVETSRTSASQLEQEIATLEGQVDTAREKSAFAARLVSELDGKIRWYAGEIESSATRLQDLDGARSEAEGALDRARTERVEREQDVLKAQALIDERAAGVAVQRRAVEQLSRAAYEIVERRSRLDSKRSRLEARQQSLESQRHRLEDRLVGLRKATETSRERTATADVQRERAQTALAAAQGHLAEGEKHVAQTEDALRSARDEVGALDREVSGVRSRVEVLQHLCRQMEGVGEGARKLVAAARDGAPALSGVRGLLVELIQTDADVASAVESALGAYASAVVVDSFADAERVAAHLADRRAGRCLLLPLDQVVPQHAIADGALSRVVRCDESLRAMVDALLGRSIEVATLAEARAAQNVPDGRLRVVTAGGEVLETGGAVAVGGESGGSGVLKRLSELRELSSRLDVLGRELEAARGVLGEAEAAHTAARRAIGEARDGLRRSESEAHRARNESESAAAELRRLQGDAGRLDGEVTEIGVELEAIAVESAQAAEESERLAAEREGMAARRDEVARVLASGETRLRAAEEARADVRVQLASVAERCASLQSRVKAVVEEVADLEGGVEEAREELEGCERRRGDAQERGVQARKDLDRAQKRREECIIALAEVRHRLSASRSRLEERRTLLETLEKEAHTVGRELQRFRLRQSEARVRVENLMERIQEELEVDLHAVWEDTNRVASEGAPATPVYVEGQAGSEVAPFDPDTVELEIQDLRDRIGRMGNVNLEALDQLDTVAHEAEDLLKQHDDLIRSRDSLLEAIKKIDAESRELFTTTFNAVRANFQKMFRRLFEGGKADIYLDEGQDVLEAGIDIVARPPGKEPRSISLLSGGERTMTAVALLFAIYQAKPSPFCLLDEVDAALDEANVHRFASVVHEFAEESQFIIISHNKRTMSAADTIFGVSMPEPGVSRRLAVRLDQVGEDGEILAA